MQRPPTPKDHIEPKVDSFLDPGFLRPGQAVYARSAQVAPVWKYSPRPPSFGAPNRASPRAVVADSEGKGGSTDVIEPSRAPRLTIRPAIDPDALRRMRERQAELLLEAREARMSILIRAPGSVEAAAMLNRLKNRGVAIAGRMLSIQQQRNIGRQFSGMAASSKGGKVPMTKVQQTLRRVCGLEEKQMESLGVLFSERSSAAPPGEEFDLKNQYVPESNAMMMAAVGKAQKDANIPQPAIDIFTKKPLQKFIRQKVGAMRSMFAAFDVEATGNIKKKDITDLMEASGINVDEGEMERIMKSMPTKGGDKGKLDVVQFTAHMPLFLEMHYKVAAYKLRGFG